MRRPFSGMGPWESSKGRLSPKARLLLRRRLLVQTPLQSLAEEIPSQRLNSQDSQTRFPISRLEEAHRWSTSRAASFPESQHWKGMPNERSIAVDCRQLEDEFRRVGSGRARGLDCGRSRGGS